MKVHIRKVCLSLFCIWSLAICPEALAYTEVWGHIDVNTPWIPSGSPYVLKGTVTIDPYVTLTIKSDVVVVTRNSSLYILEVHGSLDANGVSFPPGTPDYPYDYPYKTFSLDIHVKDNGSVALSNCDIDGLLHFKDGSSGTVENSAVNSVKIAGDGERTLSDNDAIGYIEFVSAGEPAATITDNTFINEVPFRIVDPDVNTSGIAGNYYEPNSIVEIAGILDNDKTLDCIDDDLCKYKVYLDFTVASGAALTVEPGVEVIANRIYFAEDIIVYGSLTASGMVTEPVTFSGSATEIFVESGASVDLSYCDIDGLIHFKDGSLGILTDSTIRRVRIYGAGTRKMFRNKVGYIELYNHAMAGCMAGNRITESGPFRIINGVGDTSGICNNQYKGSDPNILISGDSKNDCIVGFIDGMGDYRINDVLNIGPASRVTLARDTRFEAESELYKLNVEGSIVANGVIFSRNIRISVKDGGLAKLWHCDMNDANGSVDCQTGSSGILEYCKLNKLNVHSDASFSIVNNDFSYSSVFDVVVALPGNPDDVIDMNDNWWGTTDANEIEKKIVHHPDDEPPIRPCVNYEPLLLAPPPDLSGCAGDFEPDGDVDLFDFAYFAGHWRGIDCGCSNWCGGADLDRNWYVDFNDLDILTENWLAVVPGTAEGNFDGDANVDMADLAIFALAWWTEEGDALWNPACDIDILPDNFINWLDLAVLVDNWLAGCCN